MKQDIFDQVQRNKKSGPQQRGKAPPECPKSDKMSPFFGLAFASGDMFVKVNSTDGQCQRLISVGGANYSVLTNASRTCGPAGEWKKRIAEELSAVFFQGGLEWVRSENETIEVITEEGTFQAVVSEAKYAEQSECWHRGCGCEQANNPKMRLVFVAILVIMVGGLGYDSFKLAWEKVQGKKKDSKKRDKTLEKLKQYTADRDLAKLRKFIPKAEEANVPKELIDEAKKVVAEEEPKQKVREQVKAARESGSEEDLKAAMAAATDLGMTQEELDAPEKPKAKASSDNLSEQSEQTPRGDPK